MRYGVSWKAGGGRREWISMGPLGWLVIGPFLLVIWLCWAVLWLSWQLGQMTWAICVLAVLRARLAVLRARQRRQVSRPRGR